jgi:acyl carrier protein
VAETEKRLGQKVDPRRYVFETLRQLAGGAPAAAGDHSGLARIWAELLGLDASQIQPADNFFDLGGSSLLAMRAVAEGDQKLGLKIDPRRYVFETLGQLAVAAAAIPVAQTAKATPAEAPAKSKLFGLFGRGKS